MPDHTNSKPDALQTCSFCGKNQDEVKALIAGPGVRICDECVGVCNDILRNEDCPPVVITTADAVALRDAYHSDVAN